ncbi:MAG: hypothetical protein LBL90_00825 [Prevotellaceae bacterium]|jgi:hypothetical protein|nr:hypothetical protein [Prevotellaceae bacterium]
MGWKASMIIIQNPDNVKDDDIILKAFGMGQRKYACNTTLDECIYPRDESINIAYYNGSIIICDDFQLSGKFIMEEISTEERTIIKLFPDSEILTVSCLSLTTFHGYSLIRNGKRVRAKAMSADDGFYINIGDPIEEEKAIYAQGELRHGKYYWTHEDNEYTEDQLMEDFTFGIAKRLLGVRIDESEGEELMDEVLFSKYTKYA